MEGDTGETEGQTGHKTAGEYWDEGEQVRGNGERNVYKNGWV